MKDEPSADDIRRRMELVRSELDHDVQGIVDNARTMSDWRWYVRRYPWACLGVAAAVGYMAVPRRLEIMHPDLKTLEKLAARQHLVVTPAPEAQKKQGGLVSMLVTLAASTLARGAMTYFGQHAGEIFGLSAREKVAREKNAEAHEQRAEQLQEDMTADAHRRRPR